MRNEETYWTTGTIANKLGVDMLAVAYAIRRLKLASIGRAGMAKIYSEDVIPKIRQFMKQKRQFKKGSQ